MAVNTLKVDSRLQLVFSTGTDEDGNMVLKRKSFNNIKTNATDEQLHEVSIALYPLQQHILVDIARDDRSVLTES
ncbi:DUF1659 domain-containing protein [Halobacillus litoralis]|uniref:DUF1659 domain-containing protein n=1 Tax=Halobacillus litoralis TaxID=45668 RepID=UPI001CFD8CED|nr:DUF1659 domain-containing protein [Halobacillus litoralis]WLR47135.1 DUF1659 domain-containing protein [Halobacillus litoralis]